VLYVTAAAQADSSVPEAITLLLKAANSQHRRKSSNLNLQAHEIAAKAAQLAYELFTRDKSICKLALVTFEKYQKLAGKNIDDELEYYYTIVLQNCGQHKKAEELLKKIATRASSNLRNIARLDLIKLSIKNNSGQQQHNKMFEQLPELIADCSASNQIDLRLDALEFYCSVLLEENNSTSWRKALEAITKADTKIDPNLNAMISRAHQQLGELEKAVEAMLPAIESNNPEHADATMLLLSQVIEQIDQLRDSGNDFHGLVDNSLKVAQYCQTISQNTNEHIHSIQAHLLLAEFSIFTAERDRAKILEIEKLLDEASTASGQENTELIRCRARLAVVKKDFGHAAELWAKLAQIRRADTALSQGRSYKWWRAKFYELKCRSKQPNISKARIVHTIDVLESTIRDIPDIWANKLTLLRRQCQAKDSDPGI
jgi:predicted phage tail protein